MKRVLTLDLDNATMDDLDALQKKLDKKRKQLLKERQKEEKKDKKKYYDTFIAKAVDLYQKNDHLFDEDERNTHGALKCALSTAYEKESVNVWVEFDPQLNFGDSSPCMVDDGWCSGNLDRLGGLTFYYNRFNKDWIICDVCMHNAEPDFDDVFLDPDKAIDDMKKQMQ